MEGEQVLLKVSPMKCVIWFDKYGKLSPKFIGPFKILKDVGSTANRLTLPLSFLGAISCSMFMLKNYHGDD